MHETAYESCRQFVDGYLSDRPPGKVLDVGSRDVNGSMRPLFGGWEYVGLDIQGGDGVDVIASSWPIPFENDEFDVVVSSSMMEHNQLFWMTFKEMVRVVKNDGLIYVNAPSTGPYHGYPKDCWRFMDDAWEAFSVWCPQARVVESCISEESELWNDNTGIFRICKNE